MNELHAAVATYQASQPHTKKEEVSLQTLWRYATAVHECGLEMQLLETMDSLGKALAAASQPPASGAGAASATGENSTKTTHEVSQ